MTDSGLPLNEETQSINQIRDPFERIRMQSTIPNGKHSAINAKLTDSSFCDVCLGGARFDDVNLAAATFHNINLAGARFNDVNLSGVEIKDANLQGMTIEGILVTEMLAAYRANQPRR
jgi:uncharacterized protein YjbI with pentapeptide repeats